MDGGVPCLFYPAIFPPYVSPSSPFSFGRTPSTLCRLTHFYWRKLQHRSSSFLWRVLLCCCTTPQCDGGMNSKEEKEVLSRSSIVCVGIFVRLTTFSRSSLATATDEETAVSQLLWRPIRARLSSFSFSSPTRPPACINVCFRTGSRRLLRPDESTFFFSIFTSFFVERTNRVLELHCNFVVVLAVCKANSWSTMVYVNFSFRRSWKCFILVCVLIFFAISFVFGIMNYFCDSNFSFFFIAILGIHFHSSKTDTRQSFFTFGPQRTRLRVDRRSSDIFVRWRRKRRRSVVSALGYNLR